MAEHNAEAVNLLDATLWAKEFTWQELQIFASYMGIRRLARSASVVDEGGPGGSMFIIADGTFAVVKADSDGQRKTLTILSKGRAFGEIALFDRQTRSASVVAQQPGVVLELSRLNLERLTAEHPLLGTKVLFKLADILAQRLRATSAKLVESV